MTSLIFLHFRKNKWWAFKQMGSHRKFFSDIDGLTFYKMLGTGSDPGFSMYPDFQPMHFFLIGMMNPVLMNILNRTLILIA